MEQEGAAGKEGSAPASPLPPAYSFTSLKTCLRKGAGAVGTSREFSFDFENRDLF